MSLEVGAIVEGRVTGITKFGAFVALEGGKSGLVHISEVANCYVADINEYLQVGQSVKVRILNIGGDGKINLSIKRAAETQGRPAPHQQQFQHRQQPERQAAPPVQPPAGTAAVTSGDQAFEDKLKKFMQESDSRIADNKMYADRPRRNNRRR